MKNCEKKLVLNKCNEYFHQWVSAGNCLDKSKNVRELISLKLLISHMTKFRKF